VDTPDSLALGEKSVPLDNSLREFILQGAGILGYGPADKTAEEALGKPGAKGINGYDVAESFGTAIRNAAPLPAQGFNLKGGGLEFPVFIVEPAPKAVLPPGDKLFFQEGAVKADQYRRTAFVLHTDLEGFHGPVAEPVVAYNPNHGTHRRIPGKIPQGDRTATVFPVPGIIAEESRNVGDTRLSQSLDGCGTRALDMIRRNRKFP
jgi:hypothetical protein